MRVQRKTRFGSSMRAAYSGGLDPMGSLGPVRFRVPSCGASTSLPPFAPRPLRRFITTTEALTPVRLFLAHRSPCFTHSTVLTIPSPTTWCSPVVALPRYVLSLSATGLSRAFQLSSRAYFPHESRLRPWVASSPKTHGRNGFVTLRTGRSPPVALHPASRRRSYIRLQAGEGIPEEDSHLSDHVCSWAH